MTYKNSTRPLQIAPLVYSLVISEGEVSRLLYF
jgi:hypothetical protein